jgi:hypothetical protein
VNGPCSPELVGAEKWQGSTYQFEVVILRIWEILQRPKQAKRKPVQPDKTAWEKNLSRLKQKRSKLDAEQPVKPVKVG